MSDVPLVDRVQVLALAAEAGCDPRTIQKALKNEPIRGLVGDRARRVLAQHGLIRQQATG